MYILKISGFRMQLVVDGVLVDMDVGYEANDSVSKQFLVLFIYLILYYTVKLVKLELNCSSCQFF